MFIILLAALEGQDQDTVEAGMVDGASRWRTMTRVILPLCTPGFLSAGIFGLFGEFAAMTLFGVAGVAALVMTSVTRYSAGTV